MIIYHSIQDILELCGKEQMTFAQVIERADMEERAVTQEASYAKMQSMYEAMRHADETYDEMHDNQIEKAIEVLNKEITE